MEELDLVAFQELLSRKYFERLRPTQAVIYHTDQLSDQWEAPLQNFSAAGQNLDRGQQSSGSSDYHNQNGGQPLLQAGQNEEIWSTMELVWNCCKDRNFSSMELFRTCPSCPHRPGQLNGCRACNCGPVSWSNSRRQLVTYCCAQNLESPVNLQNPEPPLWFACRFCYHEPGPNCACISSPKPTGEAGGPLLRCCQGILNLSRRQCPHCGHPMCNHCPKSSAPNRPYNPGRDLSAWPGGPAW